MLRKRSVEVVGVQGKKLTCDLNSLCCGQEDKNRPIELNRGCVHYEEKINYSTGR